MGIQQMLLVARLAAAGSPGFSDVQLLLHGNGTNGGTTFTDNSSFARTVTPVGDAQTSTAQSKFNGSSILLDGSGDYLSIPSSTDWALPSTPWTWEMFYRVTAISGGISDLLACDAASPANGFRLVIGSTDATLSVKNGGFTMTASHPAALGVWRHVAFSSDGTTLRAFIDGALKNTATASNFASPSAGVALLIGRRSNGLEQFNGHLAEIRFTKGTSGGLYTTDFSPPTAPFPDS